MDSKILKKADRIILGSINQSQTRGECYLAIKNSMIKKEDLIELGSMIMDISLQCNSDDEITIADLTGVTVQDIQSSKAVHEALQFF